MAEIGAVEVRADVTVRACDPQDDLDVLNAGNAQWFGQEQERRIVASVPAERGTATIFVGELAGQPVGCAVTIAAPGAAFGYGMGRLYVQPSSRRRGVGQAMFARMCELARTRGLPGLMMSVPDSEPEGLAAALHSGLVVHGHHIESALDLTDPPVVQPAGPGLLLETLPEDADEQTWREVYAFFTERFNEAPDSREGGGNMPYEVFRNFAMEPWQVLLAREAATHRSVGITALMPRADAPARLNTLFTGVHPDHRGRGLSAALKTEHARLVRAAGWSEIWTQNMDGNAPILAVNRRLGFRPVGGARDLGIALDQD